MTSFDSVVLAEKAQEKVQDTRVAFALLLASVVQNVPEGRERALVLTKLEEASMWATKGISRKPE